MVKIENIYNAIKMLKRGNTLFSIDENKTFYHFKDDLVHIKNDYSSFSLNEYEFLSLFKEKVFYLKEDDDNNEEIDVQKDEEYYKYGGLKH